MGASVSKKLYPGHQIGQIQVRFVECPDRSDIFPVSLKDVGADMPVFDRVRNHMFAKIDQLIVQALDQHLPIEEINAHRSLKQLLFLPQTDCSKQFAAHPHVLQERFLFRLF